MTRKDVIFRLNSSSSPLVCIASLKEVILLFAIANSDTVVMLIAIDQINFVIFVNTHF